MAWTAPKTWSASEVATAALFNAHIRDNFTVLKTSINDSGKITALSTTYVADLSGTLLTGLVNPVAANEFTAGKQNFGAGTTTRFVLPTGVDLFDGAAGNKTAGSVWVEGDYLHHVASNQNEWRFLGTLVGSPAGAVVGSVWFESAELHYVDSTGEERRIVGTTSGMHSDAAAVTGSVWAETYVHFVGSGVQETQGHDDVAHSDVPGSHSDSHGDVAYSDVAHSDNHGDTAHTDSHGDVAHDDQHSDFYIDESVEPPHVDIHGDSHGDTAHTDSYGDVGHYDAHSDAGHVDVPHTDTHADDPGHQDSAHQDAPENIGA
jgi:hypothetical protein